MRETAVRSNEDLQRISARIEREGLEATQLLAVMIAVSLPFDGSFRLGDADQLRFLH
jgi:hypothetical protein